MFSPFVANLYTGNVVSSSITIFNVKVSTLHRPTQTNSTASGMMFYRPFFYNTGLPSLIIFFEGGRGGFKLGFQQCKFTFKAVVILSLFFIYFYIYFCFDIYIYIFQPPEECRNTIETSPFSHTERHVISHFSNVFNQKHDISHLNRTTRHCNRPELGDFPHPSVIDNDYFTKFSQPNIQTILSQPINTLRCNRRRSNRTLECNNDEIIKSDFLDYIDSIPIHALENELFGGESRRRSGTFSQDSNMVSLELVKPTMKSPSPPKLYRMNMY